MMGNINIKINKNTRQVNLSKSVIGNDGENLQEKLVFFFDSFINGTARLEILKQGQTASYVMLTKVGETYELPIKSVITKAGRLNMQLVITEGTNDEEIPVFKSNQFYMIVNSSINAEIEEDDEYPQWIDVANTKLNEIDEALDDLQDKVESGYFKGEKGDTGAAGQNGRDATINGVNTLTLTAGDNITLNQSGSTLEISATGGSGGGAVNSVNGMTGDVVIDIPEVPTNVSAFTNDAGYLTQHQDISGKQDKIDSTHKLNADLVDDSSSSNKFMTSSDQTFNGYKTFTNGALYKNYTQIVSNYQLVHKKYVDDSITNKFWIGTQTEYDAITTKDENVLYFIQEV